MAEPPVDPLALLRTIAERGGPAQAQEARRLIAVGADGTDVSADANRLWDAYLHDPYLERG